MFDEEKTPEETGEAKAGGTGETAGNMPEEAGPKDAAPEMGLMEKPAAAGSTEAEMAPKMYVGPTVAGFAIQNRVYTEVPEAARKEIEETPELANLFIEVREYPKANRMLRERSGYIFNAYMRALELRK